MLRRLRMTAAEIAEIVTMPLSTVSAVLARSRGARPYVAGRTAERAKHFSAIPLTE